MDFKKVVRFFPALVAGCVLLVSSVFTALAVPQITELMASNSTTLADQDGVYSDWVEIYNPGPAVETLVGWYLTNNATSPTKWKIPTVTIQPGAYLVIFCSGKNYTDPTQPLATNFAISESGGYIGLVEADGKTVASSISFPAQFNDVSYGLSLPTQPNEEPQVGFFSPATPGGTNGNQNNILLVDRVALSVAPGIFTGTRSVTLSGSTANEHIRYVLAPPSKAGDAIAPPSASSSLYTSPIVINSTQVLRASVFSVDDSQHGLPTTAKYVQLDNSTANRLDTFTSILPLVVFDDHGFGLLPNDRVFYPAWIGAYSVSARGTTALTQGADFFIPDTMKDHGFSSANWPKQSYESAFANDLGGSVSRTFFGMTTDKNWDNISCWGIDRTYIHNSFIYSLARGLGYWAPATKFAEMFIHSAGGPLDYTSYAGITNITERIKVATGRVNIYSIATTDITAPNVTGGYILKIDHPEDASRYFTFHTTLGSEVMIATPKKGDLVKAQSDYITSYVQQMESAMAADQASGYVTRKYLNYLDRPSWVDYHILDVLAKNDDAFLFSEYFTKDVNGLIKAGPVWDYDRGMGSSDGRDLEPTGWNPANVGDYWNIGWWKYITHDPDFMQAWIDRWQTLRQGSWSSINLLGLIDSLAATIGPAAAARDSARWPENQSRFPGGWAGEIANMKSWIATRAQWIDGQFLAAPTTVSTAATITITPASGAKLVYTLDGADPRVSGGGLAPSAQTSGGPITVSSGQTFSARSYNAGLSSVYPGSAWSSPVTVIHPTTAITGQFVNVSCRNFVGTGSNVLVAGLAISGAAGVPKEVLIRGVGPTLTQYGVPGVLAAPTLSVFDASGKLLASNTAWTSNSNAAVIRASAAAIGAFSLPEGSSDSALLLSLLPGAYTVQVSGVGNSTGTGLVEVYQVSSSASQIINVSSRAQINSATGTLISGFSISGSSAQVLVRAVGPTLSQFGVTGVLAQPLLQVYDAAGKLIATNTGWTTNANSAQIASAASSVGAFALGSASKDSALLLTLPAGSYTMQVSGVSNTTGTALAECYMVSTATP